MVRGLSYEVAKPTRFYVLGPDFLGAFLRWAHPSCLFMDRSPRTLKLSMIFPASPGFPTPWRRLFGLAAQGLGFWGLAQPPDRCFRIFIYWLA